MTPEVVRVAGASRETADTWTLALQPPGREWAYRAGQFNMLYAFGVGEAPTQTWSCFASSRNSRLARKSESASCS